MEELREGAGEELREGAGEELREGAGEELREEAGEEPVKVGWTCGKKGRGTVDKENKCA